MTQPTPQSQLPVDYGFADGKRRTNSVAVASFVLGMVGCVPFITGLLAIALGVAGIRRSRNSSLGGKGFGVAGLILGIVSVLGWSAFGAMFGYGYQESQPAGTVAKQFLQDVSVGNITAAVANSSALTAQQLQTNHGQMVPFGALQSVNISSFTYYAFSAKATMHLEGIATFANGARTCKFDLVKVGGAYKVISYWVQ